MSKWELKLADIMPGTAVDSTEHASKLFGMQVRTNLHHHWPKGLHPSNAVVTLEVKAATEAKPEKDSK